MAKGVNNVQKQKAVSKEVAKPGEKFYSWETLASFGGSVAAVKILWEVLKALKLGGYDFTSKIFPFWASVILVFAIAIFTEPDYSVNRTIWRQKGQKAVQTIVNGFLVFAAVVGLTIVAPS